MQHPRDRFITVYGRKPVAEALADLSLEIDKVLIATQAWGEIIVEIEAAARARGIACSRVSAEQVNRISTNASQDQGVVADVLAPRQLDAADFFGVLDPRAPVAVLALDGITTPRNVGMVIRSAVAAGMDGIVLPRKGVSGLNPLVLKASAGTAFRAPLVKCGELSEALALAEAAGLALVGLEAEAKESLFGARRPRRALYLLGGETFGLSPDTRARLDHRYHLPMAPGIESLNVACAATLLCYAATGRLDPPRR